jgi:hypothetical protein
MRGHPDKMRGQTELTPIVGDVIVGTVPSVPSLLLGLVASLAVCGQCFTEAKR